MNFLFLWEHDMVKRKARMNSKTAALRRYVSAVLVLNDIVDVGLSVCVEGLESSS